MASSENLPSLDSLGFLRPGFSDFWLSDLFSRETETLTRALQRSFEPALASPEQAHTPTPTPTPTASGLSAGSDPEPAATPKRQRALGVAAAAAGGRVAKRKSRATKRSQTTFITADAANFRQMVQQVTGVKLGGAGAGAGLFAAAAPIIKPEPQRGFGASAVARFHGGGGGGGGGCPPTLDTSAALLLEQSQAAPAVAMTCPPPMMTSSFVGGDVPGGLDFDAFQIFPTLESWKVM